MEKIFIIDGQEIKTQNFVHKADSISFTLNGKNFNFSLLHKDGNNLIFHGDKRVKAIVGSLNADGESMIMTQGREAVVSLQSKKMKKSKGHVGGLVSPMPGKIFKVIRPVGSTVTKGETILILEAMKMEHSIRADVDGKVKKISFKEGELVQGGVVLVELE
jgi:biotin carboxyl carrier protein